MLKEATRGGVKILWIPVRESGYKKTPLKDYQAAVLDPSKPLAAMKTAGRDKAWVKICEEIERAVNKPRESRALFVGLTMAPSSIEIEASEIRPIAQDEALRLLESVPQIELQQLHQFLFCYELYELPGNSYNASQVLDALRIGFKEPVVITKENRDSMLISAEEEYKSFDFPFKKREDEWQNEFEHVRRVLSPVFEAIPSKAECLAKISHFSRATSAAFLISEYYQGRRLRGPHTVVEVIGAIGLGIEGQFVLEDTLRRWNWPEHVCFKAAVDIAKQALKDDFERWYVGIRGLSSADDLAEYRKKEKEKDEARDRENAQELEEKLAEFIPDPTAPQPAISPEAAASLWKKADEYIARLSGLDPNDEKYTVTVESIAHKAKYLFKPYLPYVSYRIRKSELTRAKTELIAADLLAELALVKDTAEMQMQ